MRKHFFVLAVVGVLSISAPALAHTAPPAAVSLKSYTFNAGVGPGSATPCAVACGYWVANGFTPCESPFPIGPGFESTGGSYLTGITAAVSSVPAGQVAVLESTLDLAVDWDSWLCMNTATSTELAQGAVPLGQPCDNLLGANSLAPLGCHEDASTPVVAGQTIKFRVYNWSDPAPSRGKTWIVLI